MEAMKSAALEREAKLFKIHSFAELASPLLLEYNLKHESCSNLPRRNILENTCHYIMLVLYIYYVFIILFHPMTN